MQILYSNDIMYIFGLFLYEREKMGEMSEGN